MRNKSLRFTVVNLDWGQALERAVSNSNSSVLGGVESSLHHFLSSFQENPIQDMGLHSCWYYSKCLCVLSSIWPIDSSGLLFFFLYTCHWLSSGCYHFSPGLLPLSNWSLCLSFAFHSTTSNPTSTMYPMGSFQNHVDHVISLLKIFYFLPIALKVQTL